MTMDALSLIAALVAGLYEMVPWRGILISLGISVWFYATYMRAHILGRKLDELGTKLDELEEKLDDISHRTPQSIEDENVGKNLTRHPDQEAAIETAGTKTMERLYLLVQNGYRPQLDTKFYGAISLHHPSKNFEHNSLNLYPDGLVVSVGGRDETFRFDRCEDARFKKFLRGVPKPTLCDRTRERRTELAVWIFLGTLVIGSGALAGVLWTFTNSLVR